MFTMKEACEQTHLPYETLKFYCNQGLVPNVKRDKNNRRIFDERDIAWINSLNCQFISSSQFFITLSPKWVE